MCGHPDGDGMMVQCEVCLTWQHGACIGVEREEQVLDRVLLEGSGSDGGQS